MAMSLFDSASASFIPSPAITTTRPLACKKSISLALSSGKSPALNSATPTSLATCSATFSLSPVSITISMPSFLISAIASFAPSFGRSRSSNLATTSLSMAKINRVYSLSSSTPTPNSCIILAFPPSSLYPLKFASIPRA